MQQTCMLLRSVHSYNAPGAYLSQKIIPNLFINGPVAFGPVAFGPVAYGRGAYSPGP